METVTVNADSFLKDGIVTRTMKCTCGWESETAGIRSESKARHHILFTHGKGILSFAGSETVL